MKKHLFLIFVLLLFTTVSFGASGPGLSTVVIDAGHGGRDPGAVSPDNKTYEKTINLAVSKALALKISSCYPEVKVVQTRDSDVYLTLNERAEIANRNNADLFLSIHVNSSTSKSLHGFSLHILGQSSSGDRDLFAYNMDVCKRENSVILLEDDFSAKYEGFDPNNQESFIFMQLMQNAYLEQSLRFAQIIDNRMRMGPINKGLGIWQNPFYVLWKTAMPAVLFEVGFLSNSSDLSKLRQEGNLESIADGLFEAFKEYKAAYDGSVNIKDSMDGNSSASISPEVKESSDSTVVRYGVQILASKKEISQDSPLLKGYQAECFKIGDLYKYIVNINTDKTLVEKSRKSVSSVFQGAFVVKIENGSITVAK